MTPPQVCVVNLSRRVGIGRTVSRQIEVPLAGHVVANLVAAFCNNPQAVSRLAKKNVGDFDLETTERLKVVLETYEGNPTAIKEAAATFLHSMGLSHLTV